MDNKEFEELKKRVARRKSIYSLRSKIEDYEFKIIEYNKIIDDLRIELENVKKSLSNLEKFDDI